MEDIIENIIQEKIYDETDRLGLLTSKYALESHSNPLVKNTSEVAPLLTRIRSNNSDTGNSYTPAHHSTRIRKQKQSLSVRPVSPNEESRIATDSSARRIRRYSTFDSLRSLKNRKKVGSEHGDITASYNSEENA